MKCITADRVRELLAYDQNTGFFRWKKTLGSRAMVGAIAGTKAKSGYIQIQLDGYLHYAHRLACIWMTDSLPDGEIDHKNNNPSDNRWSNLRIASRSQNEQNKPRRIDNTSGYKGVYRRPGGTYYAQFKRDGRTICLGSFQTAKEAHQAYCSAASTHFGEFYRPN